MCVIPAVVTCDTHAEIRGRKGVVSLAVPRAT